MFKGQECPVASPAFMKCRHALRRNSMVVLPATGVHRVEVARDGISAKPVPRQQRSLLLTRNPLVCHVEGHPNSERHTVRLAGSTAEWRSACSVFPLTELLQHRQQEQDIVQGKCTNAKHTKLISQLNEVVLSTRLHFIRDDVFTRVCRLGLLPKSIEQFYHTKIFAVY